MIESASNELAAVHEWACQKHDDYPERTVDPNKPLPAIDNTMIRALLAEIQQKSVPNSSPQEALEYLKEWAVVSEQGLPTQKALNDSQQRTGLKVNIADLVNSLRSILLELQTLLR